nr:5-formyltetrahydrofolate cyclo-ligase [uncultured Desulfuromonas sp.]
MPKHRVRQKQLLQRQSLAAEHYQQLSLLAQRRLLAMEVFQQAKTIALYAPIRGEVATAELFDNALRAHKCVVFPQVRDGRMTFAVTPDAQSFCPGCFGVMEPVSCQPVGVEQLDLVVVPGVAFGRCGSRLGYGKGFYDQTFEVRPSTCILVGLGFSFQLENDLPKEPHDVGLDYIVTDEEVLVF